jgi:hypothetical protein
MKTIRMQYSMRREESQTDAIREQITREMES